MANLCREIFRLFALGQLAATDAKLLAAAAVKDGWGKNNRTAARLACLKAKDWRKTASRDVLLLAKGFVDMPGVAPYMVPLSPTFKLEVYFPHEVYPALVGEQLDKWCLKPSELTGSTATGLGKLMTEWSEHPDVQLDSAVLPFTGACGFHCDGVQYTQSQQAGKVKTVLVASLNVISASEQKLRSRRVPLFVVSKARLKCGCGTGCNGYCVMQKIFQVIAWSFRALKDGIVPSTRHDDSPWSPDELLLRSRPNALIHRAALLQIRGDWEALVNFFKLRSYNNADEFCWACDCTASRGPLYYGDFSPDAAYRATAISHTEYMQRCSAEHQQPTNLFRCPGTQLHHITVDAMHGADLGAFCDAIGGLFF